MNKKISKKQAQKAVETLLAFMGENPERNGLIGTPGRVIEAYQEWFAGYDEDPIAELSRVFDEEVGYHNMVIMRDIKFYSHCEHHLAPIIGTAHVAYYPTDKIVGLSKIARVVDIFARRLQTQESMTKQIADAIESALKTKGVAVMISAEHFCMSTRGVHKPGVQTITLHFSGVFDNDHQLQQNFTNLITS